MTNEPENKATMVKQEPQLEIARKEYRPDKDGKTPVTWDIKVNTPLNEEQEKALIVRMADHRILAAQQDARIKRETAKIPEEDFLK